MAYCYKLTAPRTMGKIPKGFVMQVPSSCTSSPTANEIESMLKCMGFTDRVSLSYKSSGNWKVERAK